MARRGLLPRTTEPHKRKSAAADVGMVVSAGVGMVVSAGVGMVVSEGVGTVV